MSSSEKTCLLRSLSGTVSTDSCLATVPAPLAPAADPAPDCPSSRCRRYERTKFPWRKRTAGTLQGTDEVAIVLASTAPRAPFEAATRTAAILAARAGGHVSGESEITRLGKSLVSHSKERGESRQPPETAERATRAPVERDGDDEEKMYVLFCHRRPQTTNRDPMGDGGHRGELVRLNVGGREFTVTRATLRCAAGHSACNPDNLLALIVGHDGGDADGPDASVFSRAVRDSSGALFIDRDGDSFAVVLNFLRTGRILPPDGGNKDLLRGEFDFFQVIAPGLSFDELLLADDDSRFRENCQRLLERDLDAVDDFLERILRRCRGTLLLHLAAAAAGTVPGAAVHVDLAHQQEAEGVRSLTDAEIQSAAPYGGSMFYVLYSSVSGIEHQLVCAHRARAAQILNAMVTPVGWRCKMTVGGAGWNRIRFHPESDPVSPE
jgi:BTB/POZ domain